jgi:hypothetical protein
LSAFNPVTSASKSALVFAHGLIIAHTVKFGTHSPASANAMYNWSALISSTGTGRNACACANGLRCAHLATNGTPRYANVSAAPSRVLLAITGIPSSASACVPLSNALLNINSGTNYCADAFANSSKTAMILLTTGTLKAVCADVLRSNNALLISIGTTNTASASAKKNPRVLLILTGMLAPANAKRAKSRATVQILLSGMH